MCFAQNLCFLWKYNTVPITFPTTAQCQEQTSNRSCNAGRTPSKDYTCPLSQARSEPSFMLVSPSTTYVGCERRKTVGHTQNMILSNIVASPRVRGPDVERSSDTKYICLNGCGNQDYMPITSVCTFTILCGGMRTASWEVIHYQYPALPIRPARRSTRSPINRHSPRGRRGKSSLGARSDMHLQ